MLQSPDVDLGSVRQKLKYDIDYLARMSLGLDLRILVATLLHLVNASPELIAWLLGLPKDADLGDDDPPLSDEPVPVSSRTHAYCVN